jgi:hypothetical protein
MRKLSRRDMLVMAGAAGVVPLARGGALGRAGFPPPVAPPQATQFTAVTTCTVVLLPNSFTSKPWALWAVPQRFQGFANATSPAFFGLPRRIAGPTGAPDKNVPISYLIDSNDPTTANLHFVLPWAPHISLICPQQNNGATFTQHTFTIRPSAAANTSGTFPIHVDAQATYGPNVIMPPSCCFMCADQDICIPPGHSFLCNGVEMKC